MRSLGAQARSLPTTAAVLGAARGRVRRGRRCPPAFPGPHPLGELAGVAQQVVQHLHQPAGVAHHLP